MELHIHSHRWEDRVPQWMPAAVSGFVAGAVLMVLELIWATFVAGSDTWETAHQVAALVMGERALASSGFDLFIVFVALINHYVLGIVFGLALALMMAPFHFDSSPAMAAVAGGVFGVILYVFNFYGMVYFFPWMSDMRGVSTLLAQIAFGVAAALVYWRLERREQA
jgi:hypothetical protein